jgi:hypothetical protein
MRIKALAAFLLSVTLAVSVPTEVHNVEVSVERRALNCAVVKTVIDTFGKYTSSASSFCSAYLQTSTTTTLSVAATSKVATTTAPAVVAFTTTITLYVLSGFSTQ